MTLYITVSIECDKCDLEDTSHASVKDAVRHWRMYGGVCDDDGHSALCEDCK